MSRGTLNGIAGVHLVAAELSIRGFSVAVTSRNTAGIDLFATSPESKKTYSIQVKTNGQERTPHFWLLGSKPVTPTRTSSTCSSTSSGRRSCTSSTSSRAESS